MPDTADDMPGSDFEKGACVKTLRFTYHMELRFSQPVTDHHFTFRCFPRSDDYQKISDLRMDIEPCDWRAEGVDSFGNRYVYGVNTASHSRLYIGVAGMAQTGFSEGISAPDLTDFGIYLTDSELTKPGPAILKLDRELTNEGALAGPDDLPQLLCHGIYRTMTYRPDVTHFGTRAEDSCACKMGVCQDFSHILLSLLRLHGIPCRYVAGILVGTGKSHAWVEAWQNGMWTGYDPTNDIAVTDSHISFARGRDCMDTLVNRGVFRGSASQKMYVTATAVEVGLESYFF